MLVVSVQCHSQACHVICRDPTLALGIWSVVFFCCFNMYLRRASGWIGRVKVGSLKETH